MVNLQTEVAAFRIIQRDIFAQLPCFAKQAAIASLANSRNSLNGVNFTS
ncbi:hypothetical protein [Nostoc sp. 'Lobaria pulmonaria (5183) cyanobiont']|nr:hypothetical protein [Nostoc sp. 'Lobaria pulmonaria (5183) cyanobiont']